MAQILAKLPSEMQREIYDFLATHEDAIEEIRIRAGSPVILFAGGREYCLKGRYGRPLDSKLVQDIFNSVLNHSAYAYQDEAVKKGILPSRRHRVGFAEE